MTTLGRFLFDECVGKPAMQQLRGIVSTEAEFAHITDFWRQGVKDSTWSESIGSQRGWIVITSDGGKNSKKGEKLPELCAQYRITHLVMSPTLHKKTNSEKVGALLEFWEQIEELPAEEPGTRFNLRYKEVKGSSRLVRLCLERGAILVSPRKQEGQKEGATQPPGD